MPVHVYNVQLLELQESTKLHDFAHKIFAGVIPPELPPGLPIWEGMTVQCIHWHFSGYMPDLGSELGTQVQLHFQ